MAFGVPLVQVSTEPDQKFWLANFLFLLRAAVLGMIIVITFILIISLLGFYIFNRRACKQGMLSVSR